MYRFTLYFLVGCVLFSACKKQRHSEPEYLPGDLMVGFKPNVPVEAVFALSDSLQLKIQTLHGYLYNTTFPKNNPAGLTALLNTKEYIFKSTRDTVSNRWPYTAHLATNQAQQLLVSTWLINMDTAAQKDWLNTMKQLELTNIPGDTTNMSVHLKVPVGQEKTLIATLKNYPFVQWAELNHIYNINLDNTSPEQ